MALVDDITDALSSLPGFAVETAGGAVRASWRDGDEERRIAARESGRLVVLVAGVCREEDCSPRRVLLAAAHLHGGSPALIDGKIVLRYVLPGNKRDPAGLRAIALSLVVAARRFAKTVTRESEHGGVFVHYGS